MLDVERIIRRSNDKRFDTVFFFCREDESILETRKNIPGATGFAGSFVDVVLIEDPDESALVLPDAGLPEEVSDTRDNRQNINRTTVHRDFVSAFPFDVLNLDLEGYLFKARDRIPGKLIRALRRTFEYQKRPLADNSERIDQFTLLFTTRIGPENMGGEFLQMLRDALENNLNANTELRQIMNARTGSDAAAQLQGESFEEFFKLSAPKVLAQTLMESDWYVDPVRGIEIFEFERTPAGQPAYRMLHLIMDVRRHEPPFDSRAPGAQSQVAFDAYRGVVRSLFEQPVSRVTLEAVDALGLEADLDRIELRREKYQNGAT